MITSPEQIQRVPWSRLGPEFAKTWGRAEPKNPQPEHMEIVGINGSGKTYFVCKILQDRTQLRNTPAVIICTKPADSTILKLGWPITDEFRKVRKDRQSVFWPRTKKLGRERRDYQRDKIQDLLDNLWHAESNTIVVFDEIAYAESLSPDMRDTIEMYWREGRSSGITVVGMKQRVQGANRHMSSESYWTVAFKPKDRADSERVAELFGTKKEWVPVLESLNLDKREFLIKDTRSGEAYISWVDEPLRPPEKRRNFL